MFYWIQIWWFRRPGEHCYDLVGWKINSSTSVVVLKNFPTEVYCGQHVWRQNLIYVSSGAKVAGDVHQLSLSGVGYGTSHHHISKLSISRTQFLANLSFRRLYTRVRPSLFCSMNLDSSLNQTRLQFWSSQPLTLLHHWTLASRYRRLSTAPN
jgi:hypothetical protein